MGKHISFILKPGFYDGEESLYFWPHSAVLEGFIKYVPEIEEKVIFRRIDFQRPRNEIIDLIGEENQGNPVLVLNKAFKIQLVRMKSPYYKYKK